MKRFIRNTSRFFDPFVHSLGRRLLNLHHVPRQLSTHEAALRTLGAAEMRRQYHDLVPAEAFRSSINEYEYRVYSQHGEDGILLHIFSTIGVTNRRFVEFGVEDGTECNAANLAINFGFNGLMLDGDAANIERGRRYYRTALGDHASRVTLMQSWVTAANINKTIRDHGIEGEIDLLSIDIDGNDFWVWKAIDIVQPRVLVLEYNAAFGPSRSIAIPYDPSFDRLRAHKSGFYYGASLSAYARLCAEKGLVLVGCDTSGVNAFFVRNDLAAGHFDAVSSAEAFYPKASSLLEGWSTEEQFAQVQHLPLVEV